MYVPLGKCLISVCSHKFSTYSTYIMYNFHFLLNSILPSSVPLMRFFIFFIFSLNISLPVPFIQDHIYTYLYLKPYIYTGACRVESNLCTQRFKFKKKQPSQRLKIYNIRICDIHWILLFVYGMVKHISQRRITFLTIFLANILNAIKYCNPQVQLIYKTNSHLIYAFLMNNTKKSKCPASGKVRPVWSHKNPFV